MIVTGIFVQQYTTTAIASGGGRQGQSKLEDGSLSINMVPPKELGGAGNGQFLPS